MSNGNGMSSRTVGFLALYLVLSSVITGYSVYTLWALHCPSNKPCSAQGNQNQAPSNNQQQGPAQSGSSAPTTGAPGSTGTTKAPAPNPAPNATGGGNPSGQAAKPGQPGATTPGQPANSAPNPSANSPAPQAGATTNQTGNSQTGQTAPQNTTQANSNSESIYENWRWLFWKVSSITGEARLLLLVLFMGALGSSVYALKSLGDYRGDNKLLGSWLVFYLIQPFEGSGIAILMYLAFRGGFLSSQNNAPDSINVFGMCAIAGLSGAFSDTAFMKLNEVFNTLFKPSDSRGGKIDDLVISTTSLPDGTVNVPYNATLKADNGVGTLTWTVAPALPLSLELNHATGAITGTPSQVQATTVYTFTVKDSATPPSCVTKPLSLTIKPAQP